MFSTSDDKTAKIKNNSPQQRIVVLIALEGTWNHARCMLGKIPTCVPTLHLSMEEIFAWRDSSIVHVSITSFTKAKKKFS
jgi:DTW domain-containing protein YfiP